MSDEIDLSRRRRAGRRKLDVADFRGFGVTARFNEAELAELNLRRELVDMARGEYLRAAAMGRLPAPIPEINAMAWQELARVAGNLNQHQHAINEGRAEALPPGLLSELGAALDQVRRGLLGLDRPSPEVEK